MGILAWNMAISILDDNHKWSSTLYLRPGRVGGPKPGLHIAKTEVDNYLGRICFETTFNMRVYRVLVFRNKTQKDPLLSGFLFFS